MPVTCFEKFAARVVNESDDSMTAETSWNVFGATSEVQARTALNAAIPTSYTFSNGVTGFVVSVSVKDVFESTRDDDLTHEATISYSYKAPKPIDTIEYEFDTTGTEQFTRTHAFATTNVTAGGRAVPNFFGAINPSSDGTIKGLQVEESVFQFTLVKHWDATLVDIAYQWTLAQLTKKVNNAAFGPIPKGCCKFNGARGKIQGNKWPIEYRFEVRPPETVTIRDMVVVKEGYEYISVLRAKFADTTAKKTIEVPWCCYKQQVLEYGDFSLLDVLY